MWGGGGRRKDVEWVGKGGVVAVSRKCCTTLPSHGWACVGIERGLGGESMKGGRRGYPLNPSMSLSPPLSLAAITQTFSTMMDRFNKLYKRRCVCVCVWGGGAARMLPFRLKL